MSSYNCSYCNKTYKLKSNYDKHIFTCRFNNSCKTYSRLNNDDEFENIIDLNINKLTMKNILNLLINLNNKYNKLQQDHDDLKKYVTTIKNKINVIDYLNQNYESNNDIIQFFENIEFNLENIDLIFKNDYVDGLYQIIISASENLDNSPIKAFSNNENILYGYFANLNTWHVIDNEIWIKFLQNSHKKIAKLLLKWKENNEKNMDYDEFAKIFTLYMNRALANNFEKKKCYYYYQK